MKLTRREALKSFALGTAVAAAGALPGTAEAFNVPKPWKSRKPGSFSFVHMTDMHVRRKRKGDEGYRACIESVKRLENKPAFAIMGGDNAFDGLYNEKDEFDDQINIFKTESDKLGIPYYCAIGNHDVLGLSSRRKVPVTDPDIGKKMIMDRLGMEKSYYSFDHKGWHFVILDSIYEIETESGPSYEARIGEEQLEWLARDLGKAGDAPKVVTTHIAAFNAIGQINADPEAKAMNPMVLKDNKALRLILERHKVKALLQGHSHAAERFAWRGVEYLTSNAVSGCWWSGEWKGFPAGYTQFFCEGNRLSWEYKTFDWQHHLEPEDDLERKKIAKMEAHQEEQARLLALERSAAHDHAEVN